MTSTEYAEDIIRTFPHLASHNPQLAANLAAANEAHGYIMSPQATPADDPRPTDTFLHSADERAWYRRNIGPLPASAPTEDEAAAWQARQAAKRNPQASDTRTPQGWHPQAIGTPSSRDWGQYTWTWQRNYGITWTYSARTAHDISESRMTFGQ